MKRRPNRVGSSSRNKPAHARVHQAVIEGLERRQMMSVNVTSWHNDVGLTGLNPNEQILTPANVASNSFGKLFSYAVTGQVYAQPLYVSNLNIPGKGTFNVVFVATQNNDVYAFNADSNSGPTGGLLWHVNLGLAAAMPNPYFGNRYGPYHDINPQVGITSTPVIDLSTGTMYVDAFTNDVAGQNVYSHHIHALDITTGLDKVTPMTVAASIAGNGVGGDGTTITFSAEQQLQRPALALLNGVLYVTYGGFADSDPYHGWILGFNPKTLALQTVFNDTPNLLSSTPDDTAGEAGLWQSGAGIASDGTNLFIMSGNGDFNASLGDWGDTVMKITPDNTTQSSQGINGYGLHVSDYFTPYNQQALSDADEDLGSGGGIVLPTQPGPYPDEYIGAGKQGLIYVVNRDNMGQFSNNSNNVIDAVNIGNGVFGSPAYFNEAIYYQAVGDVLKKYALTNGMLSAAPVAQTTNAYSTQEGATPSISSNGTANGIVWDVSYDPSHQTLFAYDANTLAMLYNSGQNATRDQMGAGVKFITPTIADGEVFVGSSGALTVYGLLAPPTAVPAAPSNLTATALSASSVSLNWVDNSNNESGFIIQRSTDDVNFTQLAIASVNSTQYTDTSVTPNTTYYYQVCATNVIGNSAYTAPVSVTTPSGTNAVDVYHFDEGTGTATADSAGSNNGTLTGATLPQWVSPGYLGNSALSFSGDGTYMQTASESAVQTSTDLSTVLGGTSTLDVWIKTTATGSATHWEAPAITGVEQQYGGNDINWGTIDQTGRIGLYVGDSGGIYSNNPINNGQWHNVAITRDANTGVVQLYVDGVLNTSATLATGFLSSHFSKIGALTDVAVDGSTYQGANYFNGQLDELQLYSNALGATQIQSLAMLPLAPVLTSATAAAGPVVALAFNEASVYAQSIEVDRAPSATGPYTAIATIPATSTVYDDVNVTAGVTYYYQLKALDAAGASVPSNMLSVTPPVPVVVANSIFYNNSKFDGNNGSSNLTDDAAVATDKTALLPGQTASFANITSYSKGINGIMIDVANLVYLPRPDDFIFRVGNNNNPSTWAAAPSPTYFNDYPGRGPGGSTQITLIWDDNAIQNEWLQVTMLAQPHLDLAANDVFYFGNAIGDAGADTTDAIVTAANATLVGNNFNTSAGVTNPYDINRDGVVNASDVAAVTANETTRLTALNFISLSPTAPGAVTGLTANAVAGSITLNWTAAANASSYNIYRGTSANGEAATPLVSGVSGTSYKDLAVSSANTYYYFITANSPESGPSNEVSAAPLAGPAVPGGVTATAAAGSITLNWNASTGATSYNIYRGTTAGGESATPYATGITASTYTDTSVVSTSTYYYTITALSPESAKSLEVSATPLAVAPPVPGGVTATAAPGSITLKWNASSGAISYNIYRGTSAGGESSTPYATGITGTAFTDSSVVSTSTYYYKITALTPESAKSAEVSATPLAVAPPVPSGVTATAASGSITLTWNASSGATSYSIYRGTTPGGESTTPYATGITATTYTDTAVVSTSTYYYKITALTPESAKSTEVSATPLAVAPAVPSGVTATAAAGSITLKWNASTGATSYNIYRGTTAGGESATPYATGITASTYTDSSVVSTSTYYYKITALTPESAKSAEVSATPLAVAPPVPAGVSATAGSGSITLKWNASTGATSYNVYRGTTSGGESATPYATGITATAFTDSSVVSTSTYYYTITALTPESAKSAEVSATPLAVAPPVPAGVSATALSGSIALNWNASTGATSYNIYRGTTPGGEGTTPYATGITTTTFTDSAVVSTSTYYYTVTALTPESAKSAEVSATPLASSLVKLTGAVIGTQTSWLNNGDTIQQVFDGNFNTYFDAPNSSLTNWVGLDLGTPQTISQIKFAPRAGSEFRMYGGQFQVSSTPDFSSNVVTLYTINTIPTANQFTTIAVNPGGAYRYIRYIGGTQWVNIAEMEVDGPSQVVPTVTKITGAPIGTASSYLNSGDTIYQVFDGSFTTFFDAPNGNLTNWVGLDMYVPQTITQIKFAARSGYGYRMVGGQFQVSSTPDFSSNVVTIYTITAIPASGAFTTVNVSAGAAYRYVRYVGGNQWVNIAEMEVDGYYTAPPASAKLTGTAIGTPPSANTANTSLAQAFDGNFNTYFDAPDSNLTDWVGLDLGSARNITTIKFAPRSGFAGRMIGGMFQVSSTADFSSNVTTIYTITSSPVVGSFTTIAVSVPTPFRYIRYVGGTTHVDIAEMEVDGY